MIKKDMQSNFKIGFIGQGWIGKNYANDFENRGLEVVRYGLEDEYKNNKELIKDCDIVFIAVPTPTTPDGFDFSIVESALQLVGGERTAVIKSTLVPGTIEKLQAKFPNIFVMHSPEFLREKTAAYDAANPDRNIVGIPVLNEEYNTKAEEVLSILPYAPYSKIMFSRDAELVKYGSNCFLFAKVIFMNMLYEITEANSGNYENVREAISNDPRIGPSHTQVLHASGHIIDKVGRGAGGHCFIKDMQAFREIYKVTNDEFGNRLLESLTDKNLELLINSNKDLDLVSRVFGSEIVNKFKK